MDIYPTPEEAIRDVQLNIPLIGLRLHAATRAARWFLDHFPGETLYAVKANNGPATLAALYNAGVRHFDVASLPELRQAAAFKGAALHVMHPVKSRRFIAEAYHDFGVRTFALDHEAELEKILAETGHAKDLTLLVRLACPSTYSEISLEGKFGAPWTEAPQLIRKTRQACDSLGITFHVGSQMMSPKGYAQALKAVSLQILQAASMVDIVDVGGGFPSRYPGLEPPPLAAYVAEIAAAFDQMPVGASCELWCEPGRALVAEAESLVVRVDARKGDTLYINDGSFGALYDAAHCKWVYPVRGFTARGEAMADWDMRGFDLYGPTCDSTDYLPGPFMLPDSIAEGDFIEIGNVGAYGRVMASGFNGYGRYNEAIFEDNPLLSMYEQDAAASAASFGKAASR
jgi:ornithine decarboxylase